MSCLDADGSSVGGTSCQASPHWGLSSADAGKLHPHSTPLAKPSSVAVFAQRQGQPDQLLQQEQREEQERIEAWAAMAIKRIIEQLRDDKGNPLPSQTLLDMHHHLAYLDRGCTTGAIFDKRRSMAASAGKLLQYVMDLGFTPAQARRLLNGGLSSEMNVARAIAIVNQLQQLSGSNERKAAKILGAYPRLILCQPDALERKFEYVQQISGASRAQAASMVSKQAQFLAALEASLAGLLGACEVVKCECILEFSASTFNF